jgi:putative ABC transport system permease protein
MFPVFDVTPLTVLLQAAVGAGGRTGRRIAPALRAARVNIVEGLRSIG